MWPGRSGAGRLVAALVLAGGVGAAASACGSPPVRSNSEACIARAQIERALASLAHVDYASTDTGALRTSLADLRSGISRADAAVHLPQNVDLRQLGGTPYLQTVENHLIALQTELARPDPATVDHARVQADVAIQVREAQRIADSIKGC